MNIYIAKHVFAVNSYNSSKYLCNSCDWYGYCYTYCCKFMQFTNKFNLSTFHPKFQKRICLI